MPWILGGFIAFCVPAAVGILAASPEPYWLDSPEFTAAVQTLGIPHPPGHPLYVMLAKPFTLIPLGGVAFRVALASAIFGAFASLIFFHLSAGIIEASAPELPVSIRSIISCSAALLVSVAPGWWIQCVRAEVYSLQILLVLGALYPLVVFALRPDKENQRLLYVAAFISGLSLTNHHYITIVALPAAIPLLVARARSLGGFGALRLTGRLAAIGITGLIPYIFLPIRSASGAAVSLGGVHSLKDFFWVVSAKVYQKSMARQHVQELSDRSLDALFSMMGELGPVIIVASLAGLYLLFRRNHTRMTGLTIFLVVTVTLLLRSKMGFDPFNPDYYGYMLPALACFTLGFATFCAVAINVLRSRLRYGRLISIVLAVSIIAIPVARARTVRPLVDLSSFRATRLLVDFGLERAEKGTLVLTSYYKLFFALWSARYIDGSRPDVTVINPQLFGYPGYLSSTLVRYPELRKLARAMVIHGEITEESVADLAWKGPLRIEPDIWLRDEVVHYMLPDGPVYKTSPEPLSRSDVAAASPEHLSKWRVFYHLLGPQWREHETLRMLIWCHYQDALFMARRGDRSGAKQAIEMARALGSKAPQIDNLAKALDDGGKGPIDISSFIPQSSFDK
ncbi:MAG: DUF2723 domain-containing protein [Deltaproteobacteria bacterium]|nr:DUF2723 domain-containing protein [Deltaproteobacteria bacterium]